MNIKKYRFINAKVFEVASEHPIPERTFHNFGASEFTLFFFVHLTNVGPGMFRLETIELFGRVLKTMETADVAITSARPDLSQIDHVFHDSYF